MPNQKLADKLHKDSKEEEFILRLKTIIGILI